MKTTRRKKKGKEGKRRGKEEKKKEKRKKEKEPQINNLNHIVKIDLKAELIQIFFPPPSCQPAGGRGGVSLRETPKGARKELAKNLE